MLNWFRLYLLEIVIVAVGISIIGGTYLLFDCILKLDKERLVYISVTVTGMLFIVGHVYSRLKDRRDGKRKRAQEIFLEWHSKEVSESRIFVSRWILVNDKAKLPSLGD